MNPGKMILNCWRFLTEAPPPPEVPLPFGVTLSSLFEQPEEKPVILCIDKPIRAVVSGELQWRWFCGSGI